MSKPSSPRSTKFTRLKERLFKGASSFDTDGALFVPLPIVLRVVLSKFSPREWQVLMWIYMNCGKEGVCSFTLAQLGHGIGFQSKSKLRTMLNDLEKGSWIKKGVEAGTEYYLVCDPMDALRRNVEEGHFPATIFDTVNELREQMKREPVEVPIVKEGGR